MLDLVKQFDLTEIEGRNRHRDARGETAYHPAMMLALLLYGSATGVASSRRLEQATYEDVAVRSLTAGQQGDHTRISEFRRCHLHARAKLFVQMRKVGQKAECDRRRITALIATGWMKHGEVGPPLGGQPPKDRGGKSRMWRRLGSEVGRALCARRKVVVEPCIGQIQGRGFARLLLCGCAKAAAEWGPIAMRHNLLTYYRVAKQPG